MSNIIIPLREKMPTAEDVASSAVFTFQFGNLMLAMSGFLHNQAQALADNELSAVNEASLKNLMNYITKFRKTQLPPKIVTKDFVPGGRPERKTVEQLAHGYKQELSQLGLDASIDELVDIIKGTSTEDSAISTIVKGWVENEKKKGVEII